MNQNNRLLFACMMICLPLAAFSQKAESKAEESRTSGMRKVASGRGVDVRIDHQKLEADIEAAVESALRSAEHSLESLEIHIEPIEINLDHLDHLDINLEPLVINIPQLDINIEPIEVELDDFDLNLDDNSNDDEDASKEEDEDAYQNSPRLKKAKTDKAADKAENKSTKGDKTKANGLKKID